MRSHVYCALSLSLAAAGCLVSFNDYPTGNIDSGGLGAATGSGGKGGTGGMAGAGGVSGSGGGIAGTGGTGGGGSGGKTGKGDTGGTGGTGGTSTLNADVIDDFEDGDADIFPTDGRLGNWYTAKDNSFYAMITPAEGEAAPVMLASPRAGSEWGMHFEGSGFNTTGWGALVATDLNQPSTGDALPYDASAYTGIKFWGRSGDSSTHAAIVSFPSVITTTECTSCNDHFGTDEEFTTSWQEFTVTFAEVAQDGWGAPQGGDLDTTQLIAVQFTFTDPSFNVWIDDVRFYK